MTACAPDVSRKEPNRRFSFRFDRRRRSVVNFAVPFVGALIVMTLVAHAQETKIAYAHVLGDGTLDTAKSKNVTAIEAGGNGFFALSLPLSRAMLLLRSLTIQQLQTKAAP